MTDILQLDGWTVTSIRNEPNELIIEADYTYDVLACQKCGVVGRLYKHGTKRVSYRDSPIRGVPVLLSGNVQRYKCRECDETFMPVMKGVEADRRMTTRCIEYIAEQCLLNTYSHVAGHVGCVEGTVRNIANERIQAISIEPSS